MPGWVLAAVIIGEATNIEMQREAAVSANKAQGKRDAIQKRVDAARARNETARNLQEARVKAAQAESQGQAQGATSSATQGVTGSLASQAASNIGMINTSLSAANKLSDINRGQAAAQTRYAVGAGVGKLISSAGSAYNSVMPPAKE